MKKSKKPLPKVTVLSYGRYTKWDRDDPALPKLVDLTERVKAEVGVEFGMVVEMAQARGRYLDFKIEHPPFTDSDGNVEPVFEGTVQIKYNPYSFFLGDTIWEPVEDKKGPWTMSVFMEGTRLATKTIYLI
ncbi:MAG: DUF3859 domain-containing protein [Cyclobacteriaceae bacterium]|nr:DUF3859 domain-containing protein [Cyclobacteriaceae bacterium]